jgi:transcriptional regulator with XRE-family HTH domain
MTNPAQPTASRGLLHAGQRPKQLWIEFAARHAATKNPLDIPASLARNPAGRSPALHRLRSDAQQSGQGRLATSERDRAMYSVIHNPRFTSIICRRQAKFAMHPTTAACNVKIMHIGKRIATARLAADLTQSELARRLKVTPQSVQSWEAGNSTPRPQRVQDIAAALGCNDAWLAGYNDRATAGRANYPSTPASRAHYIAENTPDHLDVGIIEDILEALSDIQVKNIDEELTRQTMAEIIADAYATTVRRVRAAQRSQVHNIVADAVGKSHHQKKQGSHWDKDKSQDKP